VFSTACDSASVVSKRQPFSFISIGEKEKSQGAKSGEKDGLGDSDVVFGQKFPGEKGNVRRCVVVMQ
jgi:hypothetical protein